MVSSSSDQVTSAAAVATLTVAAPVLEKDLLLQLVTGLCSPLQLSIKAKKKGAADLLVLETLNASLTQRNAILRALCGVALHYALDTTSGGVQFLGSSGMTFAGISSWMSVAASIRDNHDGAAEPAALSTLLQQLNDFLTTRSYLVESSSCTLADLDLYLALVEAMRSTTTTPPLEEMVHVCRWMTQCQGTLEQLARLTGHAESPKKLPKALVVRPEVVPIFYYGDEENLPTMSTLSSPNIARPATNEPPKKDKATAAAAPTSEKKKDADQNKKEAKKKKKEKKPAPPPPKELDITALDIRVGKITNVWHHESADKLFCEEIDVGEDATTGPRQIASGLRPYYSTKELQDRMVLVLCNLKARNLVGFPSHGMVLCASNAEKTQVKLVVPPAGSKIGERVSFESYDGEPEPENKVSKKKMFEALAPDLKTNQEGQVVWRNAVAKTSAGIVTAELRDAQVS